MDKQYLGPMVLGLNDSLVEMLGALAGLSIALQNTRLVSLAILITAIAGSLSMASSEYLSEEVECAECDQKKNSKKSALYTGGTYFAVAFALVLPFLIFNSYLTSLAATLIIAFVIVTSFCYYSAPIKKSFKLSGLPKRLALSFGVAGVAFALGLVLRLTLHVSV
jgi:VIT1/CCC1 family predicted Fe2+/Mn2+ transporter